MNNTLIASILIIVAVVIYNRYIATRKADGTPSNYEALDPNSLSAKIVNGIIIILIIAAVILLLSNPGSNAVPIATSILAGGIIFFLRHRSR